MKNKIVAMALAFITVIACCAFTTAAEETPVLMPVVEEKVEIEPAFMVERIKEFNDPNISTYTMEQLQILIQEQRANQEAAHKLAESARQLGWPEDSEPIISAGNEWWSAQFAIETYHARYEELYVESEMAKWDAKKLEYPAATEIWLYMKDLGWNDYVCAGIMGNLMAEVGGQTLNIQYQLYGKGYYGMCQWSRSYSEVWGTDLATQCNFLRDTIQFELDTFGYAYQKGFNFNSFLNMSNERDAAKAFAKCYERCGSSTYNIRMNNAEKAYDYFVNN